MTGVNAYTYTMGSSTSSPATGSPECTSVIMNGLTDVNGELEITTFGYTNNQLVTGRARKGTASTYYQTSLITGTIISTGLDVISLMVNDE